MWGKYAGRKGFKTSRGWPPKGGKKRRKKSGAPQKVWPPECAGKEETEFLRGNTIPPTGSTSPDPPLLKGPFFLPKLDLLLLAPKKF